MEQYPGTKKTLRKTCPQCKREFICSAQGRCKIHCSDVCREYFKNGIPKTSTKRRMEYLSTIGTCT